MSKSKPQVDDISTLMSFIDMLNKTRGAVETPSSVEPTRVVVKPGTYRIDGIVYSKDNTFAVINGGFYHLNDRIGNAKVTSITSDRITVKFNDDKEKEYRAGDIISNE